MKYFMLTILSLVLLFGCSSTPSSLGQFENPYDNYYYLKNSDSEYVSVNTEGNNITMYYFTNGKVSIKVSPDETYCEEDNKEVNCDSVDWNKEMENSNLLEAFNSVKEDAKF